MTVVIMKSLRFYSLICQQCLNRKVNGFNQFRRSVMTRSQPQKTSVRIPEATSRHQEEYSIRPGVSPSEETSVLLFPGQGSQYVGMGAELMHLPAVAELYATAGLLLGYDLEDISLHGPVERLNTNQVCGPSVLVASLGAVEKLRSQHPTAITSCYSAAGYGLGEITALVFAGAITFEEGVVLAAERGRALQMASETVASGMLLVHTTHKSRLKYACHVAQELARRAGEPNALCTISAQLHPDLVQVSVLETCLQFIISKASEFNLEKVERLPMSGGFHSKLMSPAVDDFSESLKKCSVQDPAIPVYSNISGKPYSSVRDVYRSLPMSLIRTVKLQTMFHVMYERKQGSSFPNTYHCGPGDYLLRLLSKVNAKAHSHATNIPV